jgi:nucleoside 2-deoxyribosyltransferase
MFEARSVYLAARFSRRFEMQGYRADLQRAGFVVTSRWIDNSDDDDANALRCGRIDIEDIELADILIAFPDPPRSTNSRGGHFFEEGYAHGLGRRVIVVGNRSHVFHYLPELTFFETWPKAVKALTPSYAMAA